MTKKCSLSEDQLKKVKMQPVQASHLTETILNTAKVVKLSLRTLLPKLKKKSECFERLAACLLQDQFLSEKLRQKMQKQLSNIYKMNELWIGQI